MSYLNKIVISIFFLFCHTLIWGQTFQQVLKGLEPKQTGDLQPYRYVITSYQLTHFTKNDSIVSSTPHSLKVFVNNEGVLIESGHLLMWYDKEKNVVVDSKIKTILVYKLSKEQKNTQINNPLLDTLSKNEDKIQVKKLNDELIEYKYNTIEQEHPIEIAVLYHQGDVFFEKIISKHYFNDMTYSLVQEVREFSFCSICSQYKSNYFVEFLSGTFQLSPSFKDYKLLYYDYGK